MLSVLLASRMSLFNMQMFSNVQLSTECYLRFRMSGASVQDSDDGDDRANGVKPGAGEHQDGLGTEGGLIEGRASHKKEVKPHYFLETLWTRICGQQKQQLKASLVYQVYLAALSGSAPMKAASSCSNVSMQEGGPMCQLLIDPVGVKISIHFKRCFKILQAALPKRLLGLHNCTATRQPVSNTGGLACCKLGGQAMIGHMQEIASYIKGSAEAAETEEGHLSLQQYLAVGAKRAPNFSSAMREQVPGALTVPISYAVLALKNSQARGCSLWARFQCAADFLGRLTGDVQNKFSRSAETKPPCSMVHAMWVTRW